jgi:nitronate monooxygenase
MIVDTLAAPIVLAPLAGGPSTPELTAAVSNAGGLGFLAAGYLRADELADLLERLSTLTAAPFGVNLFVPGRPADREVVQRYAGLLTAEATDSMSTLGEPRFDDDDWDAKLELVMAGRVPVASFAFGCPSVEVVAGLHDRGTEVWVTVSRPGDARAAVASGADVLVVQGTEAGGHRSSFRDDPLEDLVDGIGLLSLLQLVRAGTDRPLVAAGGIGTGAGVASVLAAGAAAAQLGTAFLCCPEAGTWSGQRDAVRTAAPTAMTRAFTGRLARGIVNRFLAAYTADAPAAYPEVHYLTSPLRRTGRSTGNADLVNLWAGQTHELAGTEPAGELTARLASEAREALRHASTRLAGRLDPPGVDGS